MSDATYDRLSYMIEPELKTGIPPLDRFFRDEFEPHTGMWIYSHPELDGIKRIYERVFGDDRPRGSRRRRKKYIARKAKAGLT